MWRGAVEERRHSKMKCKAFVAASRPRLSDGLNPEQQYRGIVIDYYTRLFQGKVFPPTKVPNLIYMSH